MSDNWQTYLTNVNGELASIRYDLVPGETVPDASRPWLHWVWVQFQSPRRDGLSSGEESARLWELEGALVTGGVANCGAAHVGCVTTKGRREFYFYGPRQDGFAEMVGRVLHGFAEYKSSVQCGSQHEPAWTQYLTVLRPSERQMDSIANREVLDSMARKGDIHERERVVTHFLSFRTQVERTKFLKAAEEAGYVECEELAAGDRKETPWGTVVRRPQGITQQQIDATTRELRGLAKVAKGEYDGWEAQVVTH